MEKRGFDITYRAQVESGEFGLKTHDGRDARIVCWDRLGHDKDFPIIALVNTDGWEEPIIYRKDGTCAANDKGYALHVIVPDDFDGIEAAYLRFRETHVATVSKLACFEGGVRYAERRDRALERSNPTYARDCCETEVEMDIYQRGVRDMREQMMKNAVEGEVVKDISNKLAVTAKINLDGFKFGDKVKVIVIKED